MRLNKNTEKHSSRESKNILNWNYHFLTIFVLQFKFSRHLRKIDFFSSSFFKHASFCHVWVLIFRTWLCFRFLLETKWFSYNFMKVYVVKSAVPNPELLLLLVVMLLLLFLGEGERWQFPSILSTLVGLRTIFFIFLIYTYVLQSKWSQISVHRACFTPFFENM